MPHTTTQFWFETYIKSAERFRDIATKAGADVLISNHSSLDGSTKQLEALANRKIGDPHPYIVGNDAVRRYLTVADECAKAGLLRLRVSPRCARERPTSEQWPRRDVIEPRLVVCMDHAGGSIGQ